VTLGSVAGPVIQATGRSEFEDGLGSGEVKGYNLSTTFLMDNFFLKIKN
jgi:hypothetical protein